MPNYEELKKTEIADVLKQEGALDYEIPNMLNELDSNPVIAIQLAKRAQDLKKMRELEGKLEKAKSSSKTISEKIAQANPLNPISSSNSTYSVEREDGFKAPNYGLFSSS